MTEALESAELARCEVIEVIDVLGGFCELVRASPTLDGSIPLRAAQACSPLLDGNRFGFQVVLRERLEIGRTLTGVRLENPPARTLAALSANVPRLLAERLIEPGSHWSRSFSRGLTFRERGYLGPSEIGLFTGLLVRPTPGFSLYVGNAGNRRNSSFRVLPRWVADDGRFVPLVLGLLLEDDLEFPFSLRGELATLAPLPNAVSFERAALADAPALGRAHFDFYDARYFADKKRGATQKYKRLLAREAVADVAEQGALSFIEAGPSALALGTVESLLTPAGVEKRRGVPHAIVENSVPLAARFDGHETWVTAERETLARFADATTASWCSALGAELCDRHRGAVWYFSKYVTPHQPGEPYFFVKPPALVSTPPGWSTLIEGTPGSGYDVLRGAVATDVFHAAPAVIRINVPHRRVEIPLGAPLARLFPFPRHLLSADYKSVRWSYA